MKGILLAAGFSTRFGLEDKLLYRLPDGRPLALAAAANLVAAVGDALAIVRPHSLKLAALLRGAGLEVVQCPESLLGMGDSLAHAVGAAPGAQGYVVALGDMPFILPSTIAAVAQAALDGDCIAAPQYRAQRGHPVAFSRRYAAELAALRGDEGARAVLVKHRAGLRLLPCEDAGVLRDIDTPDDV